jgi:DNA repair protein RadC
MVNYKSNAAKISLKMEKSEFKKAKITTSKDAADYIRPFFFEDIDLFESFFLVLLNQGNNTIGYVKISQGGVSGTVVDKILVAKYAIESLAKSVVLCHNHPSGTLNPSKADEIITKEIKAGLGLFDIRVLDHIIITSESYSSFADNGIL